MGWGQRGFETRVQGGLVVLRRKLRGRGDAHAVGIEDEGFYFGFGAVGGDFLAIPEESDSGGVADAGDDFTAGADGGMGGGDEGFLADGLAVGLDGDPGSFLGADHERQGSGGFCGRLGNGLVGGARGYIIRLGIACGIGG